MVVTPDEAISDDSAKEDSPDKGTHLSFFFQFSENYIKIPIFR